MLWFISFLSSFQGAKEKLDKKVKVVYINNIILNNISGDDNEEETPVPIPNTAVKLFDAKDT